MSTTAPLHRGPVFIVGMNGSGTTMLLDCLGRHPELYEFPYETRFIPYLASQAEKFGPLDRDENFERLWKAVLDKPLIQRAAQRVLGHSLDLPPDWRERPRCLAAIIDHVFSTLAAASGKPRWCEKTPQHVQHLDLLGDMFPAARFVHIIRDGRDCAASLHRRYGRRPEYTLYRWRNVVREGRAAGARLGSRYLEVVYEDLTRDPETTMHRICAFLDVPFHDNVLESRKPRNTGAGGYGDVKGTIEPNVAKWRSYFSPAQVARMERYAGAYLRERGYPLQGQAGDRNASRMRSLYWKWSDHLREFFKLIHLRIQGRDGITASRLRESVRSALMQSRANRY